VSQFAAPVWPEGIGAAPARFFCCWLKVQPILPGAICRQQAPLIRSILYYDRH
jgi:hypothetical protein